MAMSLSNKIDISSFAVDLLPQIRLPPEDCALRFPIYDICGSAGSKLIIALYQNNAIATLDFRSQEIRLLPHKTFQPHGVFVEDNILLISCFRRGCIQVCELESSSVIGVVKAADFFPVSSVLYKDQILSIDYINSRLISFKIDDFSDQKDLSCLLGSMRKPHSIKVDQGLICISCQDPPSVILLDDLTVLRRIRVHSNGTLMSAIQSHESSILLAIHGQGVKELNPVTGRFSHLLEVDDVTSVHLFGSKLVYSTEGGCVFWTDLQ